MATTSASASSSSGSTSRRSAPTHDDGDRPPVTQPETPRAGTVADGPTESSGAARGDVRVKLFARTDVGQIREHNEDNFLVADLTRKSRGLLEANRAATVGPQG